VTTINLSEPFADEAVTGRPTTWSSLVIRRLLANPGAVIGMVLLGLLVVAAVFAPLLSRYGPDSIDIMALNQTPTATHWLGTDYLGRDMWSRVLYGGRISLPAGFGVVAIALGIGAPMGLVAGYVGGAIDDVLMRLVDVLLAFPGILLAIGIVAILGPSLRSAVVAVGIATIPGFARIARGSTLRAREQEYVEAARALGRGDAHIIFRHILPNIVDPLIVLATLSLGSAILATAALSFLGLGTQLPTSDWGTLLSQGYEHMFESWSEVTFPGLAIVIAVLGINLIGDGLSDALNPRLWSG